MLLEIDSSFDPRGLDTRSYRCERARRDRHRAHPSADRPLRTPHRSPSVGPFRRNSSSPDATIDYRGGTGRSSAAGGNAIVALVPQSRRRTPGRLTTSPTSSSTSSADPTGRVDVHSKFLAAHSPARPTPPKRLYGGEYHDVVVKTATAGASHTSSASRCGSWRSSSTTAHPSTASPTEPAAVEPVTQASDRS